MSGSPPQPRAGHLIRGHPEDWLGRSCRIPLGGLPRKSRCCIVSGRSRQEADIAATELIEPREWAFVSKKKEGDPNIVISNLACLVAARQEFQRSGGAAIAVVYRVNIFILKGASVLPEPYEPSPLAGTKCSCVWQDSQGAFRVSSSCILHSAVFKLGW